MSHEALTPPPIGTPLRQEGKSYELVRIEPYIRKWDGADSFILHFAGPCRHPDCSVPVAPNIGLTDFLSGKTVYPNTCPEHKGYTSPEAKDRMIKGGRKGFAKMRAAKRAKRHGKR